MYLAENNTAMDIDVPSDAESEKQNEEFYSHGSPELLQSRLDILEYSLKSYEYNDKIN